MDNSDTLSQRGRELSVQIKWVILARVVFAIVLIFSTLVFSNNGGVKIGGHPFLSLYKMAGGVLALSIVYFFWLKSGKHLRILAYVQTTADTCLVTAIVFVTGCYNSIFTFLYLVVIIYTAMLLLQRGGFVVAILSSVQYGLLIGGILQNYRPLSPGSGAGRQC